MNLQPLNDLPLHLPPPPGPIPPPDIPPGWLPNPLVIGSGVEAIETYVLGLLLRLTDVDGTVLFRNFSEPTQKWCFQYLNCMGLARGEQLTLSVFAALVCAHEAGLNNSSIQNREAFYRLSSLDAELQGGTIVKAAASVGVSKWQLGIFPGAKSGGLWTGRGLSFMLIDGNIVKGSDYVEQAIPPMYLVRAIWIDPVLRIAQIEEGGWANHRCTRELYFAKLDSVCKTIGITTGGLPGDNTKYCIKLVTDNMPEASRSVVISDSDPYGVRIASSVMHGSPRHLMDLRSQRLEYAPMLQYQWDAGLQYSKPLEPVDLAEAKRLRKLLPKGDPMRKSLARMTAAGQKVSLSALAEEERREPFSEQIWGITRTVVSRPPEPRWGGHTPFIPTPLFKLTDIAHSMRTEMPRLRRTPYMEGWCICILSFPRLMIKQPNAHMREIQVFSQKVVDQQTIPMACNIFLPPFYEAYIDLNKLKSLSYVLQSMQRIVGASRHPVIQGLARELNRYFNALVGILEPLLDPQTPPGYRIAECLLLLHYLYRACLGTQRPDRLR